MKKYLVMLFICLAAAVPALPESSSDGNWERIGVVVASQTGLMGDKKLRYSYRDAQKIHELLGAVGQIPSRNLFFILAEDGVFLNRELTAVGDRISEAKAKGRKVLLQFYYSGHGADRHFHMGDEKIPFENVRDLLKIKDVDARIFVLDVCFGASFFGSKGFKALPATPLQVELEEATRGEITITSSSINEQAYEVETLEGSVFTSHWLMALRGAGDANKDGAVSLFEAYNYAYNKTVSYSAEALRQPQHPAYSVAMRGGGDLVLTRPVSMNTGIIFSSCLPGRYGISDLSRKASIGEIYIPEKGDFSIALEKGWYALERQVPEMPVRYAKIQVGETDLSAVAPEDFLLESSPNQVTKGTVSAAPPLVIQSGAEELEGIKKSTPDSAATGSILPPRSVNSAQSDREETIPESAMPEPALPPRAREGGPPGRSTAKTGAQRRPGPGGTARSGLSLEITPFFGYAMGTEDGLQKPLGRPSAMQNFFNARPSFPEPGGLGFSGWEFAVSLDDRYSLAFVYSARNQTMESSSSGREPGQGVPAAFREVTFFNQYDFQETSFGPLVNWTPLRWKNHLLGMEGAYLYIDAVMNTNWEMYRPLYDYQADSYDEFAGQGKSLEGALRYKFTGPRFGKMNFLLMFKSGIRHTDITIDVGDVNIPELKYSRLEWINQLMISLSLF